LNHKACGNPETGRSRANRVSLEIMGSSAKTFGSSEDSVGQPRTLWRWHTCGLVENVPGTRIDELPADEIKGP